jgi:predicted permease
VEIVLNDFRYALRSIARAPAFTSVTALTLALGVAAFTAGYSLVDWLLLRPMPGVRNGDRVAVVWFGDRGAAGVVRQYPVSMSQLDAVAQATPGIRQLAGYARSDVSVAFGDRAQRVEVESVMPGYFDVLGVEPYLGRLLAGEDDRAPRGLPVAVVSYDLWVLLFQRDPGAIGKSLLINSEQFTVVGVAPSGFHGTERLRAAELWLPGRAFLAVASARGDVVGSEPVYSESLAALTTGATFEQVEIQLESAGRRAVNQTPIMFRGVGMWPPLRVQARESARLLIALSGLVLVIAIANTANLSLTRAVARTQQLATRSALGAGYGALARPHLIESAIQGLLAGAVALLLSQWLLDAVNGMRLSPFGMALPSVRLDWRLAAFGSFLGLAAGLVSCLAAVGLVVRTNPMTLIRTGSSEKALARRWRMLLAGTQVALSLPLVVGTLLLASSLRKLADVNLGFDAANTSALFVTPRDRGYGGNRLRRYYRELLDRVRAAPGVKEAALAFSFPLSPVSTSMMLPVISESADPGAPPVIAALNPVSPGYFRALAIPIIAGRSFKEDEFLTEEDERPGVAIVSRSLAAKLYPGRNPVGEFLGPSPRFEIVGLAGDTRWRSLDDAPVPGSDGSIVYIPFAGRGIGMAALIIRSHPPGESMGAASAIARDVDPSVPLHGETTLSAALARYLADRAVLMRGLLILSTMAIMLAAVGLSGAVAFAVRARRREIGIRVAIGANRRVVLASVLFEGFRIAACGSVPGILGAVILAKVLETRLYGVSVVEPTAILAAWSILTTVALIASAMPAREAAAVDPVMVLREE